MAAPSYMIRAGIGGWQFAPWRGTFYPRGLTQKHELSHASRALRTIEINSTFYRVPERATFSTWREATPEGFVFSLKAPRSITQQRRLADSGTAVRRFIDGGLAALGNRLGPVVWQFPPFKRFDPPELAAFLAGLPRQVEDLPLRHVLEVRHPSFLCEPFLALARDHGVALVGTDSDTHPSFFDTSGDLVYLRLMRARADEPTGYPAEALDTWATRAQAWARGEEPDDGLPRIGPPRPTGAPRAVHMLFINGAKERAPQAAMALMQRLG